MGFIDKFIGYEKPSSDTPTVSSILPDEAKFEIVNGRLPHLITDKVFLTKGEVCHYIDKSVMMKPKTMRAANATGFGIKIWGLSIRKGFVLPMEEKCFERINGIIYVTNMRTIFLATSNGFDKPHSALTSVTPYANAIEMQYGSTHFCLIVPNGSIVEEVYNIIREKIKGV
jgi:hypothetical protein